MAPIGRPPKDPAKRKAYDKAKDTPTPYGKSLLKKEEKKPATGKPKELSQETKRYLGAAYARRKKGDTSKFNLPSQDTLDMMMRKGKNRYPALLKDAKPTVKFYGRLLDFYIKDGPRFFFRFHTHKTETSFTDEFDYEYAIVQPHENGDARYLKKKSGIAKIRKFESVFDSAVTEYAEQVRKWKAMPVSSKPQSAVTSGIPDASKRSDLNVKRLTDMSLFPEHTNWDFTSADGEDGYYVIFKDGPIKTKVRIRFKQRTDPRMYSSWHMDYKVTIPGEKVPYSEYNGGQTTKGVPAVLKKASADVRKAYSIYNKREAEKSSTASASRADKKDGGKIARFEVGKSYVMVYPGDNDLRPVYTVVSRTASYVTLTGENDRRCKVHVRSGEEFCYPDGRYSMCPVLSAGRPKTGAASKPATPLKVKPRLPSRR